ncbi:hypothetical protein CLPU_3c02590 [Gottschalkia purinilytica]|uniref:Uncharacterized protein n=1 Tax=Gottschalkia purinilytica TaxID=1503 RepID=A0A0L0WDD1_GOTPU|nr:hypothetical protein [Gottschalkia purinilytica]KNF09479.1 hypothetical protein CLPU_3c02590 [Gottschalkia purinilytica]
MYSDFITIDFLATFSGLVMAVGIIVQFTKSIIKNRFNDAAVRVYTFIIALILTFIFVKPGKGLEGIMLTILNSILITITSMGAYEALSDPKAKKNKLD